MIPERSERALRNLGVLALLKPNERISTVSDQWYASVWPYSTLYRSMSPAEGRDRNIKDIKEEINILRQQASTNGRLANSLKDDALDTPSFKKRLKDWNEKAKVKLLQSVDGLYNLYNTVYQYDSAAQSELSDIEDEILECLGTTKPEKRLTDKAAAQPFENAIPKPKKLRTKPNDPVGGNGSGDEA